ncbi:MAG: NAD(+)/NADH kinase [Candidatus Nealsonbacteria bacterium]|nr:NAD(+)/NADH kinase [Candidatus Nealsonbacteria bacterium]
MSETARNRDDSAPLRVVLLGFGGRPDVLAEAKRLEPLIARQAEIVASDFSGTMDLTEVEADLAIVLGGDGSILRASHQMGRHQLPVVAVNLGKLGFLADSSPAELLDVLPDFRSGKLATVEHLMFECRVLRGDESGSETVCHRQLGLNEVAVQTGPPFRIMDVDLYVDSELVTTYSCDGLIVSTPVGSTAHSLSAGGPILRKDLQAFVILPISPHTLTNRPVVDSADRVYELVVSQPNDGTAVVVDGDVLCNLRPGDRVRVEKAAAQFKLVSTPGHSYYRTLREKLGWGGRLQLNDGS